QAAGVGQQMPYGDRVGVVPPVPEDLRVRGGQITRDRRIQPHPPLVHQAENGRGGEGLGHRPDPGGVGGPPPGGRPPVPQPPVAPPAPARGPGGGRGAPPAPRPRGPGGPGERGGPPRGAPPVGSLPPPRVKPARGYQEQPPRQERERSTVVVFSLVRPFLCV